MIDLPDSATFAMVLSDRRLLAAAAVAGLAGLVRGFSGFGGAMVYMPLVSTIYDPRIAAVTILLVDLVSSTPFAIPEFRRCNWREVVPLAIAMTIAVPFGTWALVMLDPVALRWCVALLVLSLVPVLASGWRYHGNPTMRATVAVGLFSGVSAGAVQIAGPPVILYWLGGGHSTAKVRANLMVFFLICGVVLVIAYAWQDLFTSQALALSLPLGLPYLLGVGMGSRFFHGASDRLYRIIAYIIIALAAAVSLPILDPIVR
jgi:uncharacterized membrane protein YfcA